MSAHLFNNKIYIFIKLCQNSKIYRIYKYRSVSLFSLYFFYELLINYLSVLNFLVSNIDFNIIFKKLANNTNAKKN